MAFLVLSPALLVSVGKMAWTPIAERYLYASLAFWAPVVAVLGWQWLNQLNMLQPRMRSAVFSLLLIPFFVTTAHRAWIWQDNLRLYSDTVTKSPDFPAAKNELASALINIGRLDEAEALLNLRLR